MRVRPAELFAVDPLARLHVAAWRAAYEGLLPAEVLATVTWEERRAGWATVMADAGRQNLVCEDGVCGVTGFASFGPSPDADAGFDTAEPIGLYVRPDHWRRGVGRARWAAVAGHVDAAYPSTAVWVLRENGRARRFYEAVGFGPAVEAERATARRGSAVEVRYPRPARPVWGSSAGVPAVD